MFAGKAGLEPATYGLTGYLKFILLSVTNTDDV